MPSYALIMAAGKGKRFGRYKQFMTVKGRPLICHIVEIFRKCKSISQIIIIVPRSKINYVRKLVKNNGISMVNVIAGGGRRQDSVENGIISLGNKKGIGIIHDCVRPIINSQTIERGIKLCRKYHAVILGTPVTDTVKMVKNKQVVKTIDRKGLFLIQTPQFYDLDLLRKAYQMVDPEREYTDEAGLLEATNVPVYLFQGDRFNIKITY